MTTKTDKILELIDLALADNAHLVEDVLYPHAVILRPIPKVPKQRRTYFPHGVFSDRASRP